VRIGPDRVTPDDERPLREVVCRRCATTVLVRKNTLTQTSIQWLADAGTVCAELAERRAAGVHTGRVPRCEALRTSIDEAVAEGRLEVLDR
jgi:hypothetical protein